MTASDTVTLLRPVLSDLGAVLSRIGPDAEHAPTPCTDLDVAGLRHHVVVWLQTFAGGFADPDGRAPMAAMESFTMPPDVAADVAASADRLVGAIAAGAADRQLFLGEDGMPGEMALAMILWEYLVHGWDLARATGQPWDPAPAAAEAALDFAPAMLTPDFQGEGKPFGPRVEVAADAPAIDRLVGLSGRSPSWSPAD